MTADVPSLLSTLDPETAALVREALTLPEGERTTLDVELDATSAAYSELVADLTLWRVVGSPALYARASDVAEVLNIEAGSMSERVSDAETRGDLQPRDVIRGATDKDIDVDAISGNPADCLTTSPKGCTLVSLDGILLLAMQSRGQRGVKLRRKVKAIIDAFPKLQRMCVRLLRAHTERPAPAPAVPEATVYARRLLDGLVANGAKVLPKELLAFVAVTPVAAATPAPLQLAEAAPALDFGPEYSMGLVANARTVGMTHKKLRKLLEETGMWDDPHWVRHGDVIMSGNGKQRTETRHGFRDGWYQELLKRRDPLFGSGGGK